MKRFLLAVPLLVLAISSYSQVYNNVSAKAWADSVFKTLTADEKIAQLMVVRASSFEPATRNPIYYDSQVTEAIRKYNIGGICLFQGGPLQLATLVNKWQGMSKTPLLVTIDAENGVGMRFDSVTGLPRQMMLGAVQNADIIYNYGKLVGEQCRRMGIQVNYAPVVDINNNPNNPVINDRSFGEDKYRVALYGIQYMRGLQEAGVMACAKHFPGHGDVSVDSHHDLPVISKSRTQLDSLELYPFRQLIEAGVGSVMVAHLSIPSIDDSKNRASSISQKTVQGVLRNELKFGGLTFTDALEMKGVSNYYPAGEVSAESLIAGNDLLCLPGDIPNSIKKIKAAIRKKDLSWAQIDSRVKKVLMEKYLHGLGHLDTVSLDHLTEDLNNGIPAMRRLVAENAITVLRNSDASIFPLAKGKRVAYIAFGTNKDNAIAKQVRDEYNAHVYYFDYSLDSSKAESLLDLLKGRYDVVVLGLHSYARFPANNFGISKTTLSLLKKIQEQFRTITFSFGNPYAIKNFCNSSVLVACYEDETITQQTAADLLAGRFVAKGKLPVTICEEFKYGAGLVGARHMQMARPMDLGLDQQKMSEIDSIVTDAIQSRAIPGAVVLVARNGKIAYERAFGYLTYDSIEPVYPETIYDLASVTKIMATTLGVMKLYDEGKLDLSKTLGDYLPMVRGTNKAGLVVRDILLHRAGLQGWIPFYKETVDARHQNTPNYSIYARRPAGNFNVRVAENLYMRRDWVDTMYKRMLTSELLPYGRYLYSDMDFIFLGKIVEQLSGKPLNDYVRYYFYEPLNLTSISFLPRYEFPLNKIAPTEREQGFRDQLLKGDVHDPGAAMFGGVAGHAGLFGSAYDLAVLAQLLLNGGEYNGKRFFKKETVNLFTAYQSDSRRGLGFDKPERDNLTRKEPYPSFSASPSTFGHTGFTGTCIWMDPETNMTFIFLSNRVNNNGDANRFLKMSIRPKVHETIYQSIRPVDMETTSGH